VQECYWAINVSGNNRGPILIKSAFHIDLITLSVDCTLSRF
jgi:hypothetical protein